MVEHQRTGNQMRAPRLKLCRRQRQTLARLLRGDSEKQVARALGLSRHTVHVYVKSLYLFFHVSSRSELASSVLKRVIERIKRGVISANELPEELPQIGASTEVSSEEGDFWLKIVQINCLDPAPDSTHYRSRTWRRSIRPPGFGAR